MRIRLKWVRKTDPPTPSESATPYHPKFRPPAGRPRGPQNKVPPTNWPRIMRNLDMCLHVCYYKNRVMARPKRTKIAPPSESTADLLARIKAAVAMFAKGPDGKPQLDWNPLEQLAIFAAQHSDSDDPATKKLRIDAAKEVAKYLHPQLKGTEVAGPGGGPVEIIIRKSDEV